MIWILTLAATLYLVGLLHSVFGFYQKRPVFMRLALAMVAVAFACHSLFLFWFGFTRRHFPITNLPESLCFFAWCISLIFMLASCRYRINALGAFTLPLVSGLTILSQVVWQENHFSPMVLRSGWVYFHAGTAFLAYAAFFLTFLFAVFYLIQEKELKGKHFRFLYFRLPPLQPCDEMSGRFLYIGFAAMSLTIISGAIWAEQAWGRFWNWDPKETASLVTWCIYLFLIHYRLSGRWHAKRAAYVSILGFASILVTFGVNWGLHAFL
jgi:cytochrome c-type biogenesis protein CcsB